jgi:hypothetical protein
VRDARAVDSHPASPMAGDGGYVGAVRLEFHGRSTVVKL